jgi:hypothetical protein
VEQGQEETIDLNDGLDLMEVTMEDDDQEGSPPSLYESLMLMKTQREYGRQDAL